jgi:ribonuclease HI
MATDARKANFKTHTREATRQLWNALQNLKGLQAEWTAQDYGNTLGTDEANPDGSGSEHVGLAPAAFGAVLFATTDAIDALMDAGHATNVTNIL